MNLRFCLLPPRDEWTMGLVDLTNDMNLDRAHIRFGRMGRPRYAPGFHLIEAVGVMRDGDDFRLDVSTRARRRS